MRLLPSVMKARSLAKKLIRSQARLAVYALKSRQENPPDGFTGPFTRLLGVEEEFEQGAREEWAIHLKEWDLSLPAERAQLRQIIRSASEEALADARRSLPSDDTEIVATLDAFASTFDSDALFGFVGQT